MLVEINLLPQKESNNRSLLLLAAVLSVILLLGGFFLYWLNNTYENRIASLEGQIAATEELVLTEQQRLLAYESSNSVAELENTVRWATDYPVKTVPVINKLTALLPERGFIQDFVYEELGIVNFSVQFESSREAAFYLNALSDSEWVVAAKLNELNAVTGFYDRTFGEGTDGPHESKIKNEKYIPRYLGEYEITLNRDVLKEDKGKASSEAKGGDK